MAQRIISHSLDFHIEQRTMHRSFDTLEAAQKFAEGKDVRDIYRVHGRFKVEYVNTIRVDYDENGLPIKGKDGKTMTIWTVYLHGEPEFASDKYFEAVSRANFLTQNGYTEVKLIGEKEDGTPVFCAAGLLS